MAIVQAGILQDAVVVLHDGPYFVLLNPAIYKRMPQLIDQPEKVSVLKGPSGLFLDAKRGFRHVAEVLFHGSLVEQCHEKGLKRVRIFQW